MPNHRSKFLPLFSFLALSACATSYQQATRSDYLGNDQYEISSIGNEYNKEYEIRQFLRRRAFRVCAEQKKGFKVVTSENASRSSTTVTTGAAGAEASTSHAPGARMIIECTGEVDRRLEAEILAQEREENK